MLLTRRKILLSGFDMTFEEPVEILKRSLAAVKRGPGLATASAPVGVWVASWILGISQNCSKCLILITAGDTGSLPAPPHSLDTYLRLSPPISYARFRGPLTSWHVFEAENQERGEHCPSQSVPPPSILPLWGRWGSCPRAWLPISSYLPSVSLLTPRLLVKVQL